MYSFFDLGVWGLVLFLRFILGALVVIPLLYFIIQICIDLPAAYYLKEKGLSRHVVPEILKKLFHSPRNIFLACVWLSASIYVFGFAYIWPLGAKPLPYKIFEISNHGHYPKISVVLEDTSAGPAGKDVAATCMAAGKYYSEKLRGTVTVTVYAFPPSGFRYGDEARLGQCTYGEISSVFDEDLPFRAASVSPLRLKINSLWDSLADDFRDSNHAVLDDTALRKKISQLTGASLEEAKLVEISLQPVVELFLPKVEAQAPINPEREKILPQITKIKKLAYSLYTSAYNMCFVAGKKIAVLEDRVGEKSAGIQKKAILEKWQKELEDLEKLLWEGPTLPDRLKELPVLFSEYADSCERNAESRIFIARIYTILNTE